MRLLYKYVSAERALTCLPEVGDGALRATQPGALNDPFECAVVYALVERDKRAANREVARVLTSINRTSPLSEMDVDKARDKYGSLYLRELLSRQLSQRFGVVSFATDPRHPLMWSHYATDGAGFVVGYSRDHLMNLSGKAKRLRQVRYESRPIVIESYRLLNEETIGTILSVKGEHWSYENEWRLIVELDKTIGMGRKDLHGQPINLLRVPNIAVMSVYYTERTPERFVKEIRSRLTDPNNRYAAGGLTKLVMSATRYGYEDADGK